MTLLLFWNSKIKMILREFYFRIRPSKFNIRSKFYFAKLKLIYFHCNWIFVQVKVKSSYIYDHSVFTYILVRTFFNDECILLECYIFLHPGSAFVYPYSCLLWKLYTSLHVIFDITHIRIQHTQMPHSLWFSLRLNYRTIHASTGSSLPIF